MRSLYSGVSGLKTHQTKMDVIGNNIANVNTVAYKSSSVTFSELMYQTTANASGPNALTGTAGVNPKQIGLGVTSGSISTSITTSGSAQTTGNPFDLSITGDSFFVVSDGSSNFFTRDGSFYVDAAGNLAMSSNGYNVMGWGVDETGASIKQDTVSALRILSADNMTYPPEATTKAYISGIVDKNDTNINSASGKIVNLSFYDNLGYSYTAKLAMKAVKSGAQGAYSIELTDILDADNNSIMSTYPGITMGSTRQDVYATAETVTPDAPFTVSGTGFTLTSGGTEIAYNSLYVPGPPASYSSDLASLANAYGYEQDDFLNLLVDDGSGTNVRMETIIQNSQSGTNPQLSTILPTSTLSITGREYVGALINYDTNTGAFEGINGLTTTSSITLNTTNTGAYGNFSDITLDFSTSSNYDNGGTSTIAATNGDTDGLGTGRKLGEMSGVSIQNNGMIYATYDNGQTRLLGQIAVAEFANASGLAKEGDNLYASTMNSGEFDGIGVDISSGGGYMSTGVLEMSNVDLAGQFTEMITTQRGFQANSRIITTSDSLLEELVNLKR
jgi:flagellar hook protein FlgE